MASIAQVTPFIRAFLQQHAVDINRIAGTLDVPPTAIAAAVGEEATRVFTDMHLRSRNRATTVTRKNETDRILDDAATSYSHDEIASDFADRESDIRNGVNLPSYYFGFIPNGLKLRHPTSIDVGPGNFNLGVAIMTLRQYMANHPSTNDDPLDLKKYANDYHRLAVDLNDLGIHAQPGAAPLPWLLGAIHTREADAAPNEATEGLADHMEREVDAMAALHGLPPLNDETRGAASDLE